MTCEDAATSLGSWPNCTVPDCENKACLKFGSAKCYPHTLEDVAAGMMSIGYSEPAWAAECLEQWERSNDIEEAK